MDWVMLLEIKCPFVRVPLAGDPIKPQYLRQVQVGAEVLPVDGIHFSRFVFRRTNSALLHFPTCFDRKFHYNWKTKNGVKDVLHTGLMWWDIDCKLKEGWTRKDHTESWLSLDTDLWEQKEKLKNGKFMFFKCYQENHTEVPIVPLTKEDYKEIWSAYEELTK